MTPQDVLTAASKYFDIPEFDIIHGRKQGKQSIARFAYRWYLNTYMGMGTYMIGNLHGHEGSTVRRSINCINEWCSVDDEINALVSGFVKFVNNHQS
jgi:hypothetical protein